MTSVLTAKSTSVPVTAKAPEALQSIDAYAVAERALARAYSDCHAHHRGALLIPERNLDFCCPITVSVEEAQRLLARYVVGYNKFRPALLAALLPAEGCRVRLAREGSVCLYVETETALDERALRRQLHCDEMDLYQTLGDVRTYRVWWD